MTKRLIFLIIALVLASSILVSASISSYSGENKVYNECKKTLKIEQNQKLRDCISNYGVCIKTSQDKTSKSACLAVYKSCRTDIKNSTSSCVKENQDFSNKASGSSNSQAGECLARDFNSDGIVNTADLGLIAPLAQVCPDSLSTNCVENFFSPFLKTVSSRMLPFPTLCSTRDFSKDGIVNAADLGLIAPLIQFVQTCQQQGSSKKSTSNCLQDFLSPFWNKKCSSL